MDNVYHDVIRARSEYQFNSLFSYAKGNNFDAIVIETGTIGCFVDAKKLKTVMEVFGSTPVITISKEIENYPCVKFDPESFKTVVLHVIKEHGRKHVAYVSGPKTNEESISRFNMYRSALLECGMDYDPSLVASGDFTEYCNKEMGELLDRNRGSIDAICCANDRMAIAAYAEIEKRGLKVGEDILVTGYDNAPSALAMEPPLTTVHTSTPTLGYRAVEECVKLLHGGMPESATISAMLIRRSSCGCDVENGNINEALRLILNDKALGIDEFTDELKSIVFRYYTGLDNDTVIVADMFRYIKGFLHKAADGEPIVSDNKLSSLIVRKFYEGGLYSFASGDELIHLIDAVRLKAKQLAGSSHALREGIDDFIIELYAQLATSSRNESYNSRVKQKADTRLTNTIMSSMLNYNLDDNLCYGTIINTLRKLGARCSFLFFHGGVIHCHSRQEWRRPDTELLYAYHTPEGAHVLAESERMVSADTMFRAEYMPENRGTYVLSPLFFNDEHYGVIMCEMELDDYSCFNAAIIIQLSYAIKLKRLLDDHAIVQHHLEERLDRIQSKNQLLSLISKSDELTGIYNRRGFMELTEAALRAPNNIGKHAYMIFADLDNLKRVNDRFGHDDGDYSLKSSAIILSESVRGTDIVGRIGGDEFAAFVICEATDFKRIFLRRAAEISEHINSGNGKPYYISLSIGVHDFTITEGMDLKELLNEADKLLYENKRNKRKEFIKA